MQTFQELKRAAKLDLANVKETRLTLMGNCATQLLATAVQGYGKSVGINLYVYDVDYNQIDTQVMDENSELYESKPDFVLIQMCSEKLFEDFCRLDIKSRRTFGADMAAHIADNWNTVIERSDAKVLQYDFVEINDNVFGNYAEKVDSSFLYQIRTLNFKLMEYAATCKNAYIVNLSSISNSMGRENFFDEKYYYTAKTPISLNALPYAAKHAVDVVLALQGRFKKCVVLDLDNTLWGGVIGDDGMSGIQIGELGSGHAFTDFQLWLKELKNRGIILTVCSKNNEDTAKEPFLKHPEMVLRMDDISMFVANWEDKASNIKTIQQTLNIGMDSMVFIDDNPFERDLVKQMIPEITVPDLPEDPAKYLGYLQSLNLFETASFSEEDANRTAQYQAEISRTVLQRQFANLDDYLISLEMKAECKPFDEFHFPRIAQLTQRSNQFNLRTVRYTEDEVRRISTDDKYITRYFTLKDKFGDHGLISVLILEKQNGTLFVNTWLMSCRVLKRGVEEYIINSMMKIAKDNGYKKVIGEYLKTAKNSMVADIYEKFGFKRIGDTQFEAETDTFEKNKTFIKELLV